MKQASAHLESSSLQVRALGASAEVEVLGSGCVALFCAAVRAAALFQYHIYVVTAGVDLTKTFVEVMLLTD